MLQEETIRRNERERKVMADKINSLERSLAAADTEKRQQEVSNLSDIQSQPTSQ
jgi:hypothetical protein